MCGVGETGSGDGDAGDEWWLRMIRGGGYGWLWGGG